MEGDNGGGAQGSDVLGNDGTQGGALEITPEIVSSLTGGRFSDPAQLGEYLGSSVPKQEFDTVAEQLNQLKSQPGFANDFVKGINGLVQDGAPMERIQQFIQLSSVDDISTLNDVEAAKLAMVFKGELDSADADFDIKSRYGLVGKTPEQVSDELGIDEDDAAARIKRQEIALKKEAKESKAFLSTLRKEVYDNIPDQQKAMQDKEASIEQAKTLWSAAAETVQLPEKLSFSAKIEAKDGLPEIDFSHEFSVDPKEAKDVFNVLLQQKIDEGVKPSKEVIAEIQKNIQDYFFIQKKEEVFRSAIANYHTELSKKLLEFYSNPFQPGAASQRDNSPRQGESFYR